MARKRRVPRSSVPQGKERWIIRIAGQTHEAGAYGPVALVLAQERVMRFGGITRLGSAVTEHDVQADVLVNHEFGPPELVWKVNRRGSVVFTTTVNPVN